MTILSHIQKSEPPRHSIDRASTVETLVAVLRKTESALRESIRDEEERTHLRDFNDPCYSILARSMRARADNLRMTIATLECTRAAA